MVGDTWNGISPVVPKLLSICGGSRVFAVSSGVVDSFCVLMVRSISGIASGGITSMCGFTYISSSSWVCGGSLFPLVSTPVRLASPIIRPFWSVKIKFSGSPFSGLLTRDMTVSGIGIASQILLLIFFA